jgi:hypothetical protein
MTILLFSGSTNQIVFECKEASRDLLIVLGTWSVAVPELLEIKVKFIFSHL